LYVSAQQPKEGFQAGVNNCNKFRMNMSKETLEKWFLGESKKMDNGKVAIDTPMMQKFLWFLQSIRKKCQFKQILQFMDDMSKNRTMVIRMADISNDVTNMLNYMVRERNTDQPKGVIDLLIEDISGIEDTTGDSKPKEDPLDDTGAWFSTTSKQGFTTMQEGFTLTWEKDFAHLVQQKEPESCLNLEKVVIDNYLSEERLKYMYQTLNGIEKQLRDCGEETKKAMKDDLKDLLKKRYAYTDVIVKKKYEIPVDVQVQDSDNERFEKDVVYPYMLKDAKQIKVIVTMIKTEFGLFRSFVDAKVVELNLQNTLSK
jgi:hypothetical protein